MSKPVVFPYGITLKEGGTLDTFPAVEVRFVSANNGYISLILLLDSGATLSALPKSDALFLGIEVERDSPVYISGISGKPVKGWRHVINVFFAEKNLALPVVFLDNDESPRVLGRAGIFDQFAIIFEEYKSRSIFLPTNSKEAGAIQNIIKLR